MALQRPLHRKLTLRGLLGNEQLETWRWKMVLLIALQWSMRVYRWKIYERTLNGRNLKERSDHVKYWPYGSVIPLLYWCEVEALSCAVTETGFTNFGRSGGPNNSWKRIMKLCSMRSLKMSANRIKIYMFRKKCQMKICDGRIRFQNRSKMKVHLITRGRANYLWGAQKDCLCL